MYIYHLFLSLSDGLNNGADDDNNCNSAKKISPHLYAFSSYHHFSNSDTKNIAMSLFLSSYIESGTLTLTTTIIVLACLQGITQIYSQLVFWTQTTQFPLQ